MSVTEEILDPDIEIIDAHHHLYDEGLHHGVHTAQFLVPDLLSAAAEGHRIVGSVFVECSYRLDKDRGKLWAPLGEVRAVEAAAEEVERSGTLRGLAAVAHVDLREGEAVGEVLDAMLELAPGSPSLIVGTRHGTIYDPDPDGPKSRTCDRAGQLTDPTFRKGLRQVVDRGLNFDVTALHTQLADVLDLARTFDDATIVVGHLGAPASFGRFGSRVDEVREQWRGQLKPLAREPNVMLKLGGLGNPYMVRSHPKGSGPVTSEWIEQVWGDDIRWCIEQFGARRCMFESNYPVDRPFAPYWLHWNGFKRIVADASPPEKADLFAGTARRVYRLTF